jgi:hypothetical protein
MLISCFINKEDGVFFIPLLAISYVMFACLFNLISFFVDEGWISDRVGITMLL